MFDMSYTGVYQQMLKCIYKRVEGEEEMDFCHVLQFLCSPADLDRCFITEHMIRYCSKKYAVCRRKLLFEDFAGCSFTNFSLSNFIADK